MSHEDDLWILASNLMPYLRLLIDPTDVLERVDYGKNTQNISDMHKFWESWKIVNLIPDQTKKRQKGLLGWRHKVRTWTFHFLFWSVAHLKSFCQNMQTRQAGEFWGESFDIFPTPGQGPQKAFGRVTKTRTTRKVPSDWLFYGFGYLEEQKQKQKQFWHKD